MSMTEQEYKILTGYEPENDDLDRVNCQKAGMVGHECCGLNAYGLPRFFGKECKPEDLKKI